MIVRIARITGQPVSEIIAHPELWDAFAYEAESTAWSDAKELAAGQLEVLHMLYRVVYAAVSKEGTRQPEPLIVDHPARPAPSKRSRPMMSLTDFIGKYQQKARRA